MVYPKKNKLIYWCMHQYVKFLVRTKFQQLIFNPIDIDKNKSILLLANHFSFWDGLILHCINDKLFKKNFYFMVNEATTYKLHYLQYGGAFSINQKSRDIVQSLEYAAKLLEEPNNLVLMFPQGKLFSNFVEDIRFEKGVLRVMQKAAGKFQLVFAATFIQFYKYRKQSINVFLKSEAADYAVKNIGELKEAYQQHYNAAKKLQTEVDL